MLSRYVVHVQSYLLYMLEKRTYFEGKYVSNARWKDTTKWTNESNFILGIKTYIYIYWVNMLGISPTPYFNLWDLSKGQPLPKPHGFLITVLSNSFAASGVAKVIRWPPASPLLVAVQSVATQTAQRLTELPVEQAEKGRKRGGWLVTYREVECMEGWIFWVHFVGWVLKIRHFGWLGLYGWSRRYKEQLKRFCCKSLGMSWKKKADPPPTIFLTVSTFVVFHEISAAFFENWMDYFPLRPVAIL